MLTLPGYDSFTMIFGELLLSILRALFRARVAIFSIGLVYLASVIAGVIMVHAGNQFALDTADNIVAQARSNNPSSLALQRGDRLDAALADFSSNLLLGAVPNTVSGFAIVIPYPLVAFRGWVGGIVSINMDEAHTSRLADPGEAVYSKPIKPRPIMGCGRVGETDKR
jgi:hypothetical protein